VTARILAGVLVCAIVFGCGTESGRGAGTPAGKASWTYMVYMAADNNLWSAGLADLNEMETVGSRGGVNVVIQAEFSRSYPPGAPGDTVRGLVTADRSLLEVSSSLENIGTRDMAHPDTLREFIAWAGRTYPADRYALVIWDHGNGWKSPDTPEALAKGVVTDTGQSGSMMSIGDMAQAIELSGVHLDLVDFDACYMGMYEVAYEFLGLCDVMVFSEDVTPTDGDPYDEVLDAVAADPLMDAQTLAGLTVSCYLDYYGSVATTATKSAVSMDAVARLHAELTGLAGHLATCGLDTLARARDLSTHCLSRGAYHDLRSVLETIALLDGAPTTRVSVDRCLEALDSATIASASIPAATQGSASPPGGLSIFLPGLDETSAADMAIYKSLSCNISRSQGDATWAELVMLLLAHEGGA